MRKVFKKLHLLLGLTLVVPLLLTLGTGIILGLGDQIRFSRHPYRLSEPSRNLAVDFSSLESLLSREYRDETLSAVYLPADPNQALRIKLSTRILFLRPPDLSRIAEQKGIESDFLETVNHLHRGKWPKQDFRVVMSSLAFLMALLWPTGWLIRRKMPRRFRGRSALGVHRWFGFFGGALVILMVLSGGLLNFQSEMTRYVDPIPTRPIEKEHLDRGPRQVGEAKLVDLIGVLQSEYPNCFPLLQSIHWGKGREDLVLFYFSDNSRIYINRYTRKIEKTMGPATHWIHSLYPIHSGRVFGSFHGVFPLCLGVLTLVLTVSGLWSVSRRKLTPRGKSTSLSF